MKRLLFLISYYVVFLWLYGIVVPGVSSTIILMLLGIYPIYLTSVSNLYFPVLIPLSIGVILGSFCFMKLTKFLLEHFYAPTFYAIIGFTVGSVFVLLPNFSSNFDILIGILSFLLRFLYRIFFKELPLETLLVSLLLYFLVRKLNILFLKYRVSDQTSLWRVRLEQLTD